MGRHQANRRERQRCGWRRGDHGGRVAFDLEDAEKIVGKRSGEIETILGYRGRAEMIHRDDMILRGG
jgi:glutamate 5-kinase